MVITSPDRQSNNQYIEDKKVLWNKYWQAQWLPNLIIFFLIMNEESRVTNNGITIQSGQIIQLKFPISSDGVTNILGIVPDLLNKAQSLQKIDLDTAEKIRQAAQLPDAPKVSVLFSEFDLGLSIPEITEIAIKPLRIVSFEAIQRLAFKFFQQNPKISSFDNFIRAEQELLTSSASS